MIISDARREANRQNVKKSTWPRTEAGKLATLRNALKHGLTAATVATEDPEIRRERAVGVCGGAEPTSAWVAWLADEVATITLKLDRVEAIEAELLGLAALRPATTWGDDRRAEVEALGAHLERDPGRTAARLRQTPHGCDWLIARWTAILDLAEHTMRRPGEPRTSE